MIESRDAAVAEALAYVDDSMPPDQRRAFEERMERDPEISRRVETWLAQNEAIRAAFGEWNLRRIHPPAGGDLPRRTADPDRMAEIIRQLRQSARIVSSKADERPQQAPARVAQNRRLGLARYFNRIGLAVFGALRGSPTMGGGPRPRASDSAAAVTSARRPYESDRREAVELATGDNDALQQWFSRRLERQIVVPALAGAGFALVGGRIAPGGEGLAAYAFYQNATGQRVRLVIAAAPEAFDVVGRSGMSRLLELARRLVDGPATWS